jgi:hypothetical protein
MTVRYLNDEAALDELQDRVSQALGNRSSAMTWGRYRAKWLANVDRHVKALPKVRPVTLSELERLEADFAGTRAALVDSESQRAELKDQLDELSKTRPEKIVRQVRLPRSEVQRFEVRRSEASKALGALPKVVREAIWYQLANREMPWGGPLRGRGSV